MGREYVLYLVRKINYVGASHQLTYTYNKRI